MKKLRSFGGGRAFPKNTENSFEYYVDEKGKSTELRINCLRFSKEKVQEVNLS